MTDKRTLSFCSYEDHPEVAIAEKKEKSKAETKEKKKTK